MVVTWYAATAHYIYVFPVRWYTALLNWWLKYVDELPCMMSFQQYCRDAISMNFCAFKFSNSCWTPLTLIVMHSMGGKGASSKLGHSSHDPVVKNKTKVAVKSFCLTKVVTINVSNRRYTAVTLPVKRGLAFFNCVYLTAHNFTCKFGITLQFCPLMPLT